MQSQPMHGSPCVPSRAERAAMLSTLRNDAKQRGLEIFGEGNLEARLMLVGEAPGKEEAAAGRPFVGAAGIVLTKLLERLNISRSDLWITNIVKTRPVQPGRRGEVNRAPTASEIARDKDVIETEISIVRPRIIVCLGAIAASTLIHPNFRIRDERGRWFPGPYDSRLMATYHPAYLFRQRGPDYEAARDAMLTDLARAWGEAQSPR